METLKFEKLMLKTAFACMACDGHIDKKEIQLIKRLHEEHHAFGDIDISMEINSLLTSLNNDSVLFMKDYFSELSTFKLSEAKELEVIKIAIDTINSDEKVEYSEIKFFKVIRSKLKIKNDQIVAKHPEFETYLEEDIISDSYLNRLQADYFDSHVKLNLNSSISYDLDSIKIKEKK